MYFLIKTDIKYTSPPLLLTEFNLKSLSNIRLSKKVVLILVVVAPYLNFSVRFWFKMVRNRFCRYGISSVIKLLLTPSGYERFSKKSFFFLIFWEIWPHSKFFLENFQTFYVNSGGLLQIFGWKSWLFMILMKCHDF